MNRSRIRPDNGCLAVCATKAASAALAAATAANHAATFPPQSVTAPRYRPQSLRDQSSTKYTIALRRAVVRRVDTDVRAVAIGNGHASAKGRATVVPLGMREDPEDSLLACGPLPTSVIPWPLLHQQQVPQVLWWTSAPVYQRIS